MSVSGNCGRNAMLCFKPSEVNKYSGIFSASMLTNKMFHFPSPDCSNLMFFFLVLEKMKRSLISVAYYSLFLCFQVKNALYTPLHESQI